ncbi:MAG TPA: YitT family protein [Thermotogota bacterium]|nr:YitT family protein [Thermotogota bacterium]HPJ89831.1 YitT family protein [Thermotogota bacterium]HPR96912.1 YitT family protein [Thermotogota bacterium]
MRKVSEYIWITLGLILYSIGYMFFWSPYQIVAGGITGLSLIIRDSTGIPFAISNNVINIALLVIGIKMLGTHFGVKTVYATIMLSVILTILEPFATTPLIDSVMMSVFIGGLFCGFGVGITFSNGGSTGGTDIISLIMQKVMHISIGRLNFYINMIIIGSAYFIYNSLEIIIYGIVAMGLSSYFLDKYLQGNRQSSEIKIVSAKFSDIADKITETGRGVTVYAGTGWYTRNEKQVLTAIVSKKEENGIIRMVQKIDPDAFVSVSTVKTVYGKGFDIGVF